MVMVRSKKNFLDLDNCYLVVFLDAAVLQICLSFASSFFNATREISVLFFPLNLGLFPFLSNHGVSAGCDLTQVHL